MQATRNLSQNVVNGNKNFNLKDTQAVDNQQNDQVTTLQPHPPTSYCLVFNGFILVTKKAVTHKSPTIISDSAQRNIARSWSEQATRAISVLESFRTTLDGWLTSHDYKGFLTAADQLDEADLADWLDGLIVQAVESTVESNQKSGR